MLIVKFWKDMMSNPDNIPGEWPAETAPYSGLLSEGFILMTNDELEEYKKAHQSKFDAWKIIHEEKRKRQNYAMLRAEAYPVIGDQLDSLYKAMKNGVLPPVPDFLKAIDDVKEKYPKP